MQSEVKKYLLQLIFFLLVFLSFPSFVSIDNSDKESCKINMPSENVFISNDATKLATAVIKAASETKGLFHVAISGGSLPKVRFSCLLIF